MYKLKAFTLVELMVGMIISSIVISFCYTGYSVIYKQYLNYKTIKQELMQTMELNTVLGNDFVNSEIIRYDENKLIMNSKNVLKIEYDFNETFILRKENEVVDTFNLGAQNMATKFVEGSGGSLVTNFSFDTMNFKEKENFHFIKSYSAETVLNACVQITGSN